MDIRLKTRVEGVHIWLPIDEAVKFIKNPRSVQAEVGIMLHAGNINPETGEPREPLGFDVKLGPRPGSQPIDKPKKRRKYPSKPAKKKRATFEKVDCDYCDRVISSSQMKKHIKTSHPEVVDSIDDDLDPMEDEEL